MAKSPFLLNYIVFVWCLWSTGDVNVDAADYVNASCVIARDSGVAPIYGTIYIWQLASGGISTFQVNLEGFNASTQATQHGFHVHESGSLGNKCNDAGAHYNPDHYDHGAPTDAIRHVGDLGNIEVKTDGKANVQLTDNIVSLVGDRTVIGRSIVVHELIDDLGKGSFNDSKTTGHAGKRFGCCTIVSLSNGHDAFSSSIPSLLLTVLIASLTNARR